MGIVEFGEIVVVFLDRLIPCLLDSCVLGLCRLQEFVFRSAKSWAKSRNSSLVIVIVKSTRFLNDGRVQTFQTKAKASKFFGGINACRLKDFLKTL